VGDLPGDTAQLGEGRDADGERDLHEGVVALEGGRRLRVKDLGPEADGTAVEDPVERPLLLLPFPETLVDLEEERDRVAKPEPGAVARLPLRLEVGSLELARPSDHVLLDHLVANDLRVPPHPQGGGAGLDEEDENRAGIVGEGGKIGVGVVRPLGNRLDEGWGKPDRRAMRLLAAGSPLDEGAAGRVRDEIVVKGERLETPPRLLPRESLDPFGLVRHACPRRRPGAGPRR